MLGEGVGEVGNAELFLLNGGTKICMKPRTHTHRDRESNKQSLSRETYTCRSSCSSSSVGGCGDCSSS